jgi:hypothetical protein
MSSMRHKNYYLGAEPSLVAGGWLIDGSIGAEGSFRNGNWGEKEPNVFRGIHILMPVRAFKLTRL